MIPQTNTIRQADKTPTNEHWQKALANSIKSPEELFNRLGLDAMEIPASLSACKDFPLRVPKAFVDKMIKGDWQDPLLLQILPRGQELDHQVGFSHDPLNEANSNPMPGIIHKYKGRVLLIISNGCAVNCRYCFRRHFPYNDNNPSRDEWQQTLDYIRSDSSIREVIFSGGDPLAASDTMLAERVNNIAKIEHVETLRVHSRMPLVIPQRITPECLNWLTGTRLKTVMVIHCNHPNEIDDVTGEALQNLSRHGVTMLNQAVLLKGINDNAETLAQLSHKLFQYGVLPYYLHLLDKVQGAAHFQVSEQRGQQLFDNLLSELPGYLVPKLVQEIPGAPSKMPVNALRK